MLSPHYAKISHGEGSYSPQMEPTNIWSIPLQIHSDRTKQWGLQHFKTIVFNQNIEIFNVIVIKMT